MDELRSYSPEDVIAVNLRETALQMSMVTEQEMAHLREQAVEIVTGVEHSQDLLAALPDHRPPRFVPSPLPQNAQMLERHRRLSSVWRSVLLCTELRRLLEREGEMTFDRFFAEQEETEQAAQGRVVYQRNSYADTAFLRFAKLLGKDPRAVYTGGFTGVCEEVYNGTCEYCILPIENSAEGPLNSFTRLIDRYDLKIAATCDVPTTDGSRITRFALLRRTLTLPPSLGANDLFFEFIAPLEGEPSITDVLSAAQCCGLRLSRLDTRAPSQEELSLPTERVVLRTDQGDLAAFLLYLAMELPQYTPVGIYPHLTENK